ncbi:MAG TPA: 4-hydroxy-tetrahydrodipicolinate reductase [Steroidobacteraceae bacterium]|nr:4-hydroxy-tetrahydrodipicolinate reductase [Steroidobacteraceae bacterium]
MSATPPPGATQGGGVAPSGPPPSGAQRGESIRLTLTGASGHMGAQILRLLEAMPAYRLVGAVVSERSAALGQDAGRHAGASECGVPLSAALAPLLPQTDLVIDFSAGAAVAAHLAACTAAGVPLLIGTTGVPGEIEAALQSAAQRIALLVAANTSLGVSVLLELVRRAAAALPPGFEVEILDVHHSRKVDAPSGTALALGRAVAAARAVRLEEHARMGRHGAAGPRTPGEIGFAAVRGGDVVGEHEVRFLGPGETLILAHRATDRAIFARGALQAGRWLVRQPPGRYAMEDVLSI